MAKNINHRLVILMLPALVLAILVGCSEGQGNWAGWGAGSSIDTSPPTDAEVSGTTSMEEVILWSDAIVRAELLTIETTTEQMPHMTGHVGALEFKFRALEYIKGSGGSELVAVATSQESFATQEEARLKAQRMKDTRDTQYDDREAIVFLSVRPKVLPSSRRTDRYWLGGVYYDGLDWFSISSRLTKRWLPEAMGGADGSAGASGEKYFLTDVPETQGATGSSGNTREEPSIGMSDFKAKVAALEAEVAGGGGSPEYRQCLVSVYFWRRDVAWLSDNGYPVSTPEVHNITIDSGLAAGTNVAVTYVMSQNLRQWGETEPAGAWKTVVLGDDATLFSSEYPGGIDLRRPLPAGSYVVSHETVRPHLFPCYEKLPEEMLYGLQYHFTVTTPEGTLHEAFFDPVTLGSGVGVEGSSGVLSAAGLTVDGTSTSISGLKWNNDQVVLSWTSHTDLEGYALEFIELDGSIGLRLAGSDATEDAMAKTLTWAVTEQPWHDGDQLMLRISSTEFRVSVVASDANPSENQSVDFTAKIVNGPSEGTPTYKWEMNFGGEAWARVSSSETLRYLEKPGLRRGVRVTVSYAGGESGTSGPLWVTWE